MRAFELFVLAIPNAAFILGLYWAAWFDWRGNSPMAITRRNARTEYVNPDTKMVLWFLRYWTFKLLGKRWGKPVLLCTTCMSSVHSTYFYYYFNKEHIAMNIESLFSYLFYVFMLAGILAFTNYFSNE